MKRASCAVVAAVVLLFAARAAAEPPPPTHLTTPVVCRDDADPPNELQLAPDTIILTPEAWDNLDLKVKDLQESRTRLTAENESLRESARPSWWWAVSALAAGAAAGYAAGRLF
jgi:hypothetical protein